jgi:hypothetical protein
LQAGDVVDLPEGRYHFRVLGDGPVELVTVWKLPPEFWAPAPPNPPHRTGHAIDGPPAIAYPSA